MLNKNKSMTSHVCLSNRPESAAACFILRTTEQISKIFRMNVSTLKTTPNSNCFKFSVFYKNNEADTRSSEVEASVSQLLKRDNCGNESFQNNKCSRV